MLASIQRISKIEPIKDADKIEKAEVLGWQVVVKKGEFNVNDLIVYVEIDTVLPETDWSAFLKEKDFRIRSIRLKNQLSQGIIFPLSILEKETNGKIIKEGLDVSDIIGIKHYEKPVPASMKAITRGNFPGYLIKTDEEKIQNHPEYFNLLKDRMVYITTKCDGTSATFSMLDGDYHVCSRNLSLKNEHPNIYWQMSEKYGIEEILKKFDGLCIQGEICGKSIQGNKLGLKEHELFVFNVYDIHSRKYMDCYDLIDFCKENKLQMVPLEMVGLFKCDLIALIEKAKGYYTSGKLKEGIVVRTIEYPRISFKVLNNDALLKNKE